MEPRQTLHHFVLTYPLPQRAKVIEGYQDPFNPNIDFSTGDVIDIRRIVSPFVELTFQNPSNTATTLSVPSRNPTRFRLMLNDDKPLRIDGVRRLCDVWPLAVKPVPSGTTRHRTGPQLKPGEVLRLIRLDRSPVDGATTAVICQERSTSAVVKLPIDYEGTFEEVIDTSRLYTLGEICQIARAARTLYLSRDNQASRTSGFSWIVGIPDDFEGNVRMEAPQYLVEIATVGAGSDSDSENEDECPESYMIPMTCEELLINYREPDYLTAEMKLIELDKETSLTKLPCIVRVMSSDTDEETTVLRNHLVRPGDQLVLNNREIISKLEATVGSSRLLIPTTHPGLFSRPDVPGERPTRLRDLLVKIEKFPCRLVRAEGGVTNVDRTLPVGQPIVVQKVIRDNTIVAWKLLGNVVGRAFHLPTRTSLTIGYVGKWTKDLSVATSDEDSYAEQLHGKLPKPLPAEKVEGRSGGKPPVPTPPRRTPSQRPTVPCSSPTSTQPPKPDAPKKVFEPIPKEESPVPKEAVRNPTPSQSIIHKLSATTGCLKKNTAGQVERKPDDKPQVPTPMQRTQSQRPVVTRSSPTATQPPKPAPRNASQPASPTASQPVKLCGTATVFRQNSDPPNPTSTTKSAADSRPGRSAKGNVEDELGELSVCCKDNDFESYDDGDSEEPVYQYVAVDQMLNNAKRLLTTQGRLASIPADGNVRQFTVEQLLVLLHQMNAPGPTLLQFSELKVNGAKFAEMSNRQLAEYKLLKPLIVYFRDRSKKT